MAVTKLFSDMYKSMKLLVFKRYLLMGLAAAVTLGSSSFSVVAQDTPVSSGPKATVAGAKPAAEETAELAKATQNPVAVTCGLAN